jgi:DNA modification methylase
MAPKRGEAAGNQLFYGDNLEVLRQNVPDNSVDLVYLDPPFNSNRNYNVLFGKHDRAGNGDRAQIQAFSDTWTWTAETEEQYAAAASGGLPSRAADALTAFRTLLGEGDAMAYLVNMAPRLVELHRVLKPTGSLYLHCDPTMSHYLKVLLDAVFGPENFRNEVIWKRISAHSDSRGMGAAHDVILFYSKNPKRITWNRTFTPYTQEYVGDFYRHVELGTGRRYRLGDTTISENQSGGGYHYEWHGVTRLWRYPVETMRRLHDEGRIVYSAKSGLANYKRYLDEMPGVPLQDVWTDIAPVQGASREKLGYPTQKPVVLLERIISASSNPGDVVLDPFCGCGTTIDAAQRLGRKWIGIDVTYIAIDLIMKRLSHAFPGIDGSYAVHGIPRDMGAARALFTHSPFDFERWAVSLVSAQPNEKQVGDKGIDGVARFHLGPRGEVGRLLVSVKGGKTVNPTAVRDLGGTIAAQKAQMGILITLAEPSRGVLDAVNHGGTYTWPVNGQAFPRLQAITIAELLAGKRPDMPGMLLPYIQAPRAAASSPQLAFGEE